MRRYRKWAGNQKGSPEDPLKCIAQVADGGRSPLFHQCNRSRGHGPAGEYCKQHAAKLDQGRNVYVPR